MPAGGNLVAGEHFLSNSVAHKRYSTFSHRISLEAIASNQIWLVRRRDHAYNTSSAIVPKVRQYTP
jgi:hypothetical protein